MAPPWFYNLSLAIHRVEPMHYMAGATVYSGFLYTVGYSYQALVFFTTMVAVLGVVGALKVLTSVERPTDCRVHMTRTDRAFPSGHVAAAAHIAAMVPYTFPYSAAPLPFWLVVGVLTAFVLIVALSRLTLRVHTLVQVLAGLSIGVAVPLAMTLYIDLPFVFWLLVQI
jgi:membrane-associated phospholipid phosphatase